MSKGIGGSIVRKRTVHLLPSERIKGVRMLRVGVCTHPGALSLSLFSFPRTLLSAPELFAAIEYSESGALSLYVTERANG